MAYIKTVKDLLDFLESLDPDIKIAVPSGCGYSFGITARVRQENIRNEKLDALPKYEIGNFLILE